MSAAHRKRIEVCAMVHAQLSEQSTASKLMIQAKGDLSLKLTGHALPQQSRASIPNINRQNAEES
jgi:hypothetical protein